ncbi:MAG: GNAT family N-acetyltransferase [Candidatus Thermoplasmatota archaeon]|nr:GNAT family N-acetyltransferase [Candidatus Thermoplasmatota archaeon]
MENRFRIKKIQDQDRLRIIDFIVQHWESPIIISKGKEYPVDQLEGFIAVQNNTYVGLITIDIKNDECQIVTLNAEIENIGIGTALLNRAIDYAIENKCTRVWLVTTNDNTPALRFYQTRNFKLKALYCDAMEFSRKLKPEIPLYGIDSIPIRDEIELEYLLSDI